MGRTLEKKVSKRAGKGLGWKTPLAVGALVIGGAIESAANYISEKLGNDRPVAANVARGSVIENFKDLIYTDGASSQYIQMARGPPVEDYDNLMIRDSYGNDSVVEKTGVWRMGFAENIPGPGDNFVFGGYANNDNNLSNDNPTILPGWCDGYFYDSVFTSGESVDRVYIVHDKNGDGIGDLTGTTWTLGPDDFYYTTNDIEFNEHMGMEGISQIPIPTYDETTLILPHTVVTPEPLTAVTLALGGAGLAFRRRRKKK